MATLTRFKFYLLMLTVLGLSGLSLGQVTVAPITNPRVVFFTATGAPCSGCQLDTFSAGTTNALVTYSESTGTTPNTNPIILASDGSAVVYPTSASYKYRLRASVASGGATLWTQDNVSWSTPLSTFPGITSTGNVLAKPSVAATGGANQSSPTLCISGFYFNVTSLTDQWCLVDTLGTGTSPTSTFSVTHSGSGGTATFQVPGLTNLGNETIAGTLGVTGTISASIVKQVSATTAFNIQDNAGVSHFFIAGASPFTNTFVNGNGGGVVFLGSAAKTSVADTTGNIVTAGSLSLQKTDGTLPAIIANDTAGGIVFTNNAGGSMQFGNGGTLFLNQPQGVRFTGATSGNTVLQAAAIAGAGTLTLPATVTDTLVGKATTDIFTGKTYDTAGSGNVFKIGGATINGIPSTMQFSCTGTATPSTTLSLSGGPCTNTSGVAFPVSSAATIANLRCKSQSAGVNASSGLVTVRKNGVAQTDVCTIGTGTSCADITHTFAVAAGDTVDLVFTTQGAETLANIGCIVEKQ